MLESDTDVEHSPDDKNRAAEHALAFAAYIDIASVAVHEKLVDKMHRASSAFDYKREKYIQEHMGSSVYTK